MFAYPGKPVVPNYKVSEMDHSLTSSLKPIINTIRKSISTSSVKRTISPTTHDDNEISNGNDIRPATRAERSGDGVSYSYNANQGTCYSRKEARRMYRVLILKENPNTGEKTLIDSIDGKIYNKGFKFSHRHLDNCVLFDTKEAALSERYPSNQAYAGKGGNGRYPRILVAFDAWGTFRKRLGGGSSYLCENAIAMNILKCLDPQQPMASRLCERYVDPYFYTKGEVSPTTRQRSSTTFRKNRFFDQ